MSNQPPKGPKRPKGDKKKAGDNARTQLQIIARPQGHDESDEEYVRREFLRAYEFTCGNVSASCEFIGISRQAYYRWMSGSSVLDKWFQSEVEAIKPDERLLDLAAGALITKINEGDTAAIMFTLRTKGRHRGFSERPEQQDLEKEQLAIQLEQIKNGIDARAQAKGVDFKTELKNFLEIMGNNVKPEIREKLASELEM